MDPQVSKLIKQLQEADKAYYDQNSPILSDGEYDRLVGQYKALTGEIWMSFGSSGSTQHVRPMLSLAKAVTQEEFDDFTQKWNNPVVCVMPKLDGGSLALTYKDGKLIRALTRGKLVAGVSYGEDVLDQVKEIVPTDLKIQVPGLIEVRGEVVMFKSNLDLANQSRKDKFKNCRNAATGIMRNNKNKSYLKYLSFIAYELFGIQQDLDLQRHSYKLETLRSWGFNVPWYKLIKPNLQDVLDLKPSDLDYEIDGMVITINDLASQESLGMASKYPLYSLAIKSLTDTAETTLREIKWEAGRIGRVTPVAVFDEVQLDGTSVSRATLHNLDHVKTLDVIPGSTVVIYKAGQIIPQVKEIVTRPEGNLELPLDCPNCSGVLEIKGPDLYCSNLSCPPKLSGMLVHACSKTNLDIDGMGEEVAQALVDNFDVKSLVDLVKLSRDPYQVSKLGQLKINNITFGEKRSTKLAEQINKATSAGWSTILRSLGIPGLGHDQAAAIAENFSVQDFVSKAVTEQALTNLKGIGKETANEVLSWFASNKDIDKLDTVFSNTTRQDKVSKSGPLVNLNFVITGTHSWSRSKITELIEANGGHISSSVSKATSYLVAGDEAGSKLDKANKLNIPVIDLEALIQLTNK